jgi:NAD(P)-dependent dehydrogenase (short-subunit alcohol dehydrogenase family)
MRVNARSVFLGCKYAITQMLKQEAHVSGDRGWIVNMSSVFGLLGGPTNRKSLTKSWGKPGKQSIQVTDEI